MRDVLNSHSVANLKKEISKTNIKGYSKLKKADVINLMLKHKDRFSHIKHTKDSKLVKKVTLTAERKKELLKKDKERRDKSAVKKVPPLTEKKGKKYAVKTTELKGVGGKGGGLPKKEKPKPKHPSAMGDPKGFASYYGVNPGKSTTSLLTALGQVEPHLLDIILKDVSHKEPTQELYNELKSMRGFKAREFAEKVKQVQKPYISGYSKKKKEVSTGYFYKFVGADVKRLLSNIRGRPQNTPGSVSHTSKDNRAKAIQEIAILMEKELARLKPGQDAYDKKQSAKAPKDPTKVNMINVRDDVSDRDGGEWRNDDYTWNIIQNMTYSGELKHDATDKQNERAWLSASNYEHNRLGKSISAFIKGKKFKTSQEASIAYLKHMKDNNISYGDELDKY